MQNDEKNQNPSISPRKLEANRRNAQKSSGPKTAEGKEKSKQNSAKHNIFSRQLFPPTDDGRREREGYVDVVAEIYEHYEPKGVMEKLLVDKIATESIRFARLLWYESQGIQGARAFWNLPTDRLLRYQTGIDRQLTKARKELEDLQAKRKSAAGASETSDEAEPDGEAEEHRDLPEQTVPGDDEQLILAASKERTGTGNAPVELASEAIAVRTPARGPCEASIPSVQTSTTGGPEKENYKTNPPVSTLGSGDKSTTDGEAAYPHSLAEIIAKTGGLEVPQEATKSLEPTSNLEINSHHIPLDNGSDDDAVYETL